MLPVLQIGRFALQLPGLLVILGVWVGLNQAESAARRRGLRPDALSASLGLSLVIGILSARASFVLAYLSAYLPRPLDALSLNPAALDPWGGLVGGAAAMLVLVGRRQLAIPIVLDAMAPGLATFSVFLGLSHLASGAAWGAETSLPWAVQLWGASRHPTQVLEAVAGLVIFAGIRRRMDPVAGQTFLLWLAASAAAALWIEGLRGDSPLGPGGVRWRQLVDLALAVLALSLFGRLARRPAGPAAAATSPIPLNGGGS